MKVDFSPENSDTTRYQYVPLIYAEKLRKWQLTAAEWTESVQQEMMKSQLRLRFAKRSSVSVLQIFFVHCSGNEVPKTYIRNHLPV